MQRGAFETERYIGKAIEFRDNDGNTKYDLVGEPTCRVTYVRL